MTKYISESVQVDDANRVLVLETPNSSTFGIWRAQAVRGGSVVSGEWHVYLETNGNPMMIPHPSDAEALADWLADAGITRNEFDAAIGDVEWYS